MICQEKENRRLRQENSYIIERNVMLEAKLKELESNEISNKQMV